MSVTVVGLGPGGPDMVTAGTLAAIERIPARFLRTARHPAAEVVADAEPFDALYEAADDLEAVYCGIVEALVEAADRLGEVLYAVPGSPRVAERSVELLLADSRIDVEVVPALSFADLAWTRLGIDPLAAGVRLVDGRRFAVEAAGDHGPLLVAQCDSSAVLSDVKLSVEEPPAEPVLVLARLGLPEERIVEVDWADLDRAVSPDHLTSLYIPRLADPVASEVQRFDQLVTTLRRECPWDRQQTHESLRRHLIEETYEVLDAIDRLAADGYGPLEEELGDLLFHVFLHATLAREEGQFTLADVARGVHDKLEARHPHVFGDATFTSVDELAASWEQMKRSEKGRDSIMDGIPSALPSLLYALKAQRKAASQGRPTAPAPGDDGVGAALFALVDEARRQGVDPEDALRATTQAFIEVFKSQEQHV